MENDMSQHHPKISRTSPTSSDSSRLNLFVKLLQQLDRARLEVLAAEIHQEGYDNEVNPRTRKEKRFNDV